MEYEDLLEEFSGLIPLDDPRVFEVDWATYLGIKKWEATIPAHLAGQVKGAFPTFIKKTDQERCQNLVKEIFEDNINTAYEVTIKLDGTSVTYYHHHGVVGACSRNLELKINEENKDNSIVSILLKSGLDKILPKLGNIAIQGELMGPGIQGNRENLKALKFFIFDIQNLDTGKYYTADERQLIMVRLSVEGVSDVFVNHVPVVGRWWQLHDAAIENIDQLLKFAEGPSINHPVREGFVFKREDGGFSFKAISNAFLAKEKD